MKILMCLPGKGICLRALQARAAGAGGGACREEKNLSALPKGCSGPVFASNTGLEMQHSVLSALGGGMEKRRRSLEQGELSALLLAQDPCTALPGSMHRSSAAAAGKQSNWQSMPRTSAAAGALSGCKSKTYKKQETRAFGHRAAWRTSTASAASRPSPVERVVNLLREQWHQQLVSCSAVGLWVLGKGQTAAWGSKEHPNFSG